MVLNLLEENSSVHGDLQSNNIMVKVSANNKLIPVDNRVIINAIDFDWAGNASEVFYPVMHNESIHGLIWPGKA
jgi:thiamine kinase-like enzyme